MEKHVVPGAHAKQPTGGSTSCKSVTTSPRVLPLCSSPLTPSPLSTRTNTNQVTPPVNKSASFDQQRQHDQPPRHDQQPSYTWADAHTVMIIYHWHKDAQETLLGDPVAGFEPGDAKTLRLERAEQRNCGLCEKQYLAYEGMVPLPCGCWFHQKCIKPRLAEWFGCPECGVEMVWVLGVSR